MYSKLYSVEMVSLPNGGSIAEMTDSGNIVRRRQQRTYTPFEVKVHLTTNERILGFAQKDGCCSAV